MQELRTEHFGISVTDIERSIAWYGETLGFTLVKRFEKPALQIRGAAMTQGSCSLEILQPDAPEEAPAGDRTLVALLRATGANHFAVSVADVRSMYEELAAAKAELVTELLDGRFFFCRDPDGTLIEIRQGS